MLTDEYIAQMITRQVRTLPGVGLWLEPPFSGSVRAIVAHRPGVCEVRVERFSGQVLLANFEPAMVELFASSLDTLVALSLNFGAARSELAGATGRRRHRIAEKALHRLTELDPVLAAAPNKFWVELVEEIRTDSRVL